VTVLELFLCARQQVSFGTLNKTDLGLAHTDLKFQRGSRDEDEKEISTAHLVKKPANKATWQSHRLGERVGRKSRCALELDVNS
jgi:hypothetical protein